MIDEDKKSGGLNIFSMLKFLLGIAVVILGVVLTIRFFGIVKVIFLACLGPFLILVGLIMVAAAKE